jgi:3-polyprenyl-4-hydroxybenzoate decarboxylase
MWEGTASRVMAADGPYGEFYDFYSVSSKYAQSHHVTRHNTPILNILSTTPQLSISQKALGMLPDDGNVKPKNVGINS